MALYTSGVASSCESINWRKFLARPPLPCPGAESLMALRNQRILISGAGGSIGSALATRLAQLEPRGLILLEASEGSLFRLQRALGAAGSDEGVHCVLGSVLNRRLLEELFDLHAPNLVLHAAAFKHVPLLEEHPFAAIENNIFGTERMAAAATAGGARVVLLSTDKAVAPASILGASKRVAELIVRDAGGTALRLGNILGSSGSVAEAFAEQIAGGGPVTVTDPAARRYFLTLEEGVDLLLMAAAEPACPSLLVPELSTQHFVADLARFMAGELLAGTEDASKRTIAIEFTSPRPGDKESEVFWSAEETVDRAILPGLLSVRSAGVAGIELQRGLEWLRNSLEARDLPSALEGLRSLVPNFEPSAALMAHAQQRRTRVMP